MPATFTPAEWKKIRATLDADPTRFGLPARTYGSVVLASFNIRKLGDLAGRDDDTWSFLAHVCGHFDLLSLQEVQRDMSGLRELAARMGDRFATIVSDKVGAFVGEPGLVERMAFVYNWSLVKRGELATIISYDRSKVIGTIARHNDAIHEALADYGAKANVFDEEMVKYEAGSRARRPPRPPFKVEMPVFLTFIRPPYCVAFEIHGHPGTEPYRLLAIDAHLHYGESITDRRQEFDALMQWIVGRAQEESDADYPNIILMGDLNLDYDDPARDRARIEAQLKSVNARAPGVRCNFPFLDPHKGRAEVFRSNARLTETFDQIGLFARDPRLPDCTMNAAMDDSGTGPDYGVFDFVDLFAVALAGKPFAKLTKKAQAALVARFENNVSDHLPLWLRLPLP